MSASPLELLNKYWKHNSFKSNQLEIINSILSQKDTIVIMATGGGKSICYQIPALIFEGLTIVISPLISLMKDQVEKLNSLGIEAAYINSTINVIERDRIYNLLVDNQLKLLYLSPEKIKSKRLLDILCNLEINQIAIDEAHCISQWGYDFRPSYLELYKLKEKFSSAIIVALTATANPKVQLDIKEKLNMTNPKKFISTFEKKNLNIFLKESNNKIDNILELSKKYIGNSMIIFVNKHKSAELISNILVQNGIYADYYHGGLSNYQREKKQNYWLKNDSIIVCTNAFGMGIDNPKVSIVIHYEFPDSIERYYQEIGRVGRSGQKSIAIALFNNLDFEFINNKIRNFPTIEKIKSTLILLFNYFDILLDQGKNLTFDFNFIDFYKKFNLNKSTTKFALDLLNRDEYISIQDEYYKPAKIKVISSKVEVDNFFEYYKDYYQFFLQLVRTFEGLHTEFREVDLMYFAIKNHYNLEEVILNLKFLKKHSIIDFTSSTYSPTITFLENRRDVSKIFLDYNYYSKYKSDYEYKLNKVNEYLRLKENCRTIFILNYFGEKMIDKCNRCDLDFINNTIRQSNKKEQYIEIRFKIKEEIFKNNETKNLTQILEEMSAFDNKMISKVLDRMVELGELKQFNGFNYCIT